MADDKLVVLQDRFRGPPTSASGGYVCGHRQVNQWCSRGDAETSASFERFDFTETGEFVAFAKPTWFS